MEAAAPGGAPAEYDDRACARRRRESDDDGFGVVAGAAVGDARGYAQLE